MARTSLERTLAQYGRELAALSRRLNRLPGPEVRRTSRLFHAYHAAGGVDVSSGWTDIPLDTPGVVDDAFSHTPGAAAVTVLRAGWYQVSYYAATDILAYANRTDSEARLVTDSGSGFALLGGSLGPIYNRITAQGRGQAVLTLLSPFTAGEGIKLQARRRNGSSTIQTVGDACGLTITFLRS